MLAMIRNTTFFRKSYPVCYLKDWSAQSSKGYACNKAFFSNNNSPNNPPPPSDPQPSPNSQSASPDRPSASTPSHVYHHRIRPVLNHDEIGKKIFIKKTLYRSFGAVTSTMGLSFMHDYLISTNSLYPMFMIAPVCLGAFATAKLFWQKAKVVPTTLEVNVDNTPSISAFQTVTIPVIERNQDREIWYGLSIFGTSVLTHACLFPPSTTLSFLSLMPTTSALSILPLSIFGGAAYYAKHTPLSSFTMFGAWKAGVFLGFLLTTVDILTMIFLLPTPLHFLLLPHYTVYQDVAWGMWSMGLGGILWYSHLQYPIITTPITTTITTTTSTTIAMKQQHTPHTTPSPYPDPLSSSLFLHAVLYSGLSLSLLFYAWLPEDYTRDEVDFLRRMYEVDT